MAYTKQTWADLPSKTTPINAERLTHIEDGIFNAAQTADTAASTAGTAAANIGIVTGRVETLTGRVNGLDTAVSNKVDKVAGKGLSTNDYDDTDKGKVDALGTASTKNSTSVVTQSTDLVESGAVYDAIKGSVGFVTTGKNLFDGKATSKTDQYGVTWTVDPTDNNVVTVSGTPTDVEAFRQFSDKVLPTGTYKFYGLSDTTNIAFNALVLYQDNTVVRVITGITEGGEFEILSSDVYNRIGIEYRRGVNSTPCSGTIRTMITKSTVTNTSYEPYHASVEESLEQKCDNSVIGTVEGATASKAWSVGEHFIKDGAFKEVTQPIASGGAISDSNTVDKPIAELLTPKYQSITKNGLDISAGKYGKIVLITISNGTCTDPVSANDSLVNLSDFSDLFTANDKFIIPFDALDTYGKTLRIWGMFNGSSVKVRENVSAGTVIRVTIVALLM